MENIFTDAEHGVEVVVKDVAKGAEFILSTGEKTIKVIVSAKKLTPQLKTELALLLDDCKPIAVALAPVIATGGKDPVADFAALAPVATNIFKLVKDFVAYLPTLELAVSEIAEDVK